MSPASPAQLDLFRKSVEALRDKALAAETRYVRVGGQLYGEAVATGVAYTRVLALLDSFTAEKDGATDET